MLGLGLGMGVGNKAPLLPVSALPSIDAPGALVLGSDGVVNKVRFSGNYVNNSVITATDRVSPINSFNANNDFSLLIKFRQDANDSVAYSGLFCQGPALSSSRGLWIDRSVSGADYFVQFFNSSGVNRKVLVANVIDGEWHALEITRTENSVAVSVDSIPVGNIDLSGFVVNTVSTTTIGSQANGNRAINGQIIEASCVCQSGGFAYLFDQPNGMTILDASGNENNGTLVDAAPTDFWKKILVPVSLLT